MKFLKLYRYDLRHGLLAKPVRWLVMAALGAFYFFCFCLDVFHLFFRDVGGFGEINALGLSFGDVVMTQMGGILPPEISLDVSEFAFPVEWLFLHALILYFTLEYTSGDLTRCGVQVMTRARGKIRWWLSKCLWNITAVASYYAVFVGVLLALSALTGKEMSMSLNGQVFAAHFNEALPGWVLSGAERVVALCVMPGVVGLALGLAQMALTLYIKPMIAFLVVCAYTMAGVFCVHPALVSNYALTVRSRAVGFYALTNTGGLLLCGAIALLAVAVGCVRVQKMDLIGQGG